MRTWRSRSTRALPLELVRDEPAGAGRYAGTRPGDTHRASMAGVRHGEKSPEAIVIIALGEEERLGTFHRFTEVHSHACSRSPCSSLPHGRPLVLAQVERGTHSRQPVVVREARRGALARARKAIPRAGRLLRDRRQLLLPVVLPHFRMLLDCLSKFVPTAGNDPIPWGRLS